MRFNYHNLENYAAAWNSLRELYAYRKTYTVDQLQVLPQNIKYRESKVGGGERSRYCCQEGFGSS